MRGAPKGFFNKILDEHVVPGWRNDPDDMEIQRNNLIKAPQAIPYDPKNRKELVPGQSALRS